jgi:polar amino acid transport system substrate-binding protein
MVFDSIITDIQTGKDDCSISAFTITADREKTIDFSNQYYENKGQAIMTKVNSTIQGPSDLVGHNVGAEKGTVGYYDVLNISGYNPSDLHGYETMPDSFLALQNGDVDAVVGDYAVMEPFVNQNAGEFTFAPNFMSETEYFGIVVNKNNPELTAAINAALANIKADGRYQQIYNKWFGQ